MKDKSVKATMLIRRPADVVFRAFVEPGMLRQFWLADASGPLAPGARVTWKFRVPGVQDSLVVRRFEPPRRLAFRFSDGMDVDMEFEEDENSFTCAGITCSGFDETRLLAHAADTVEGFSIVLCDLKSLLELGRSANLVRDKVELIQREMQRGKSARSAG